MSNPNKPLDPRPRLHREYLSLKRRIVAVHRCHTCGRRAVHFLATPAGQTLPRYFGGYCAACRPQQPEETETDCPVILGFDDANDTMNNDTATNDSAPELALIAGGGAR